MPTSAGVLLFRRRPRLEMLLVHPGGPFWRRRDQGTWQIPKGFVEPGETPETAARREVAEELGIEVVDALIALGSVRQAGGKIVHAFAVERDFDPAGLTSNMVEIEWPPASGRMTRFPEIDAARWFAVAEVESAMLASQLPFVERLLAAVDHSPHCD